ncbi:hypothetical protein BC832DRAFT_53489 [Gaertneriomyces semiglobifer]|nr:hypothetical protein BC832DRAFT_53489 [Gaertneriomyces semiglobifer]
MFLRNDELSVSWQMEDLGPRRIRRHILFIDLSRTYRLLFWVTRICRAVERNYLPLSNVTVPPAIKPRFSFNALNAQCMAVCTQFAPPVPLNHSLAPPIIIRSYPTTAAPSRTQNPTILPAYPGALATTTHIEGHGRPRSD